MWTHGLCGFQSLVWAGGQSLLSTIALLFLVLVSLCLYIGGIDVSLPLHGLCICVYKL